MGWRSRKRRLEVGKWESRIKAIVKSKVQSWRHKVGDGRYKTESTGWREGDRAERGNRRWRAGDGAGIESGRGSGERNVRDSKREKAKQEKQSGRSKRDK